MYQPEIVVVVVAVPETVVAVPETVVAALGTVVAALGTAVAVLGIAVVGPKYRVYRNPSQVSWHLLV